MATPATNTIFLRLKWRLAFNSWERKLARWVEAAKAGFDPNQPRVSAGNPDGGQWTSTGGSGGGSSPQKPRGPRPHHRPRRRRPSPVKRLTVPTPKVPSQARSPLPNVPRIPKRTPPTRQLESRIAKELGKWLLKAAVRRALGPIGIALDVIDGALWLHNHYPDIQSYFDEPRSLEELQEAANDPLEGYEIHHIVERTAVERDGIGDVRTNSPENLVRIPTWRHHEITAWYMTRSDDFGGLSPREYLRGRS